MEPNVFMQQNRISTLSSTHYNLIKHKPQHPPYIVSVLKKPSNHDISQETTKNSIPNVYNDSWFDLLAINHLSKTIQAATGRFIPFYIEYLIRTRVTIFLPPYVFI
jgi:hypothetical protein